MARGVVYMNGRFITMNPKEERADWIKVADGKIVGLGKAGNWPKDAEEYVDLRQAAVLPGLFDAHTHVMPTGYFLSGVNLLETKSLSQVMNLLEAACKEAPEGDWVFGAGFMSQNMKENRFPTCRELDRISHGHPVMVSAQTLHGISLNSKGMEMITIPDVAGVEKYKDGKLTGVLLSDDAVFPSMAQVFATLPEEKLFAFMEDCCQYAAKKGVTTIIGLLGQFVAGDRDVDLVLERGDDLPVNVAPFYQTWDLEKIKERGLPRIGGCLTLDGAGFEYTMALQTPYPARPERRGFLIHTDEEIYQLISKAHREGIQCALHALGDRAIDQLIYVFQQVIMEQGNKDLRHRIEHFSLPTEEHMEIAAKLGLILSMQPAFSGLWGQPVGGAYEDMLGRQRADQMEVFPEILKRGGIICGGSDSPVTLIDPLFGIASCVHNPDPRRNVSVTDAIKFFTYNAAYSVHMEDRKGSLEVGKDADFTVIDKDPYECADSEEIYNMKVLMTVKGGDITYDNLQG